MECPSCGTRSDGNFCPSCGANMRASSECASCGAKLVPGARFCTRCGTATGVASSAPATGSNIPWYIGGGLLLLIAIVLAVPLLRDDAPESGTPPVQDAPFAGSGAAGTPPPLSDNPRENADRLFNRIMNAWSANDTAQARQFTPMAIAAYDMAQPLDDDGLYHLAMIHNVAGDHAAARSTAEQVLAKNPDHLLALAAAIEATMSTDAAAARSYAQRFLDAYDSERARTDVPEYLDHDRVLPGYLDIARGVASR